MLNLEALRIFVAAAERRSFTRAALDLGLAQPTISRVIKNLEKEWGERLFYRTGRGVELSPLGEAALKRAKTLLREVEQVSEDLRALSRVPSGEVSLAVPPSIVSALVPRLVSELREELPGIRLRIREGFSDYIERWLANGAVEVGVFSKYREVGQPGEPALFTSPLMLARSAVDGPMPERVDFVDLAGKPLVLPTPPNGLRLVVDATARRLRFALNVIVDAESIGAQKLIAAECGCYMVKAAHTLTEDRSAGAFAAAHIVNPGILRYLVLQTSQARPLTRAAREVADRVKAIIRSLPQKDEAAAQSNFEVSGPVC